MSDERIPVVGVARRLAHQRDAIVEAVDRVVASGRVLLGDETAAFESEFAQWVGQAHTIAVASGTEGLRLALRALDIGPGDEVIIPAFTAVPTAAAVCAAGASPVPVDVEADTAAISHRAAAAARTDRTRAVVAVHLYGRPAPLPDLGVPVISDAAQAHGALNAPTGNDDGACMTAYSFYPTKNLGGIGDGGAVVTNDGELADRLRLLRMHGLTDGYVHTEAATNARLSELEAAVLRDGLRELDAGNARRRTIAATLREAAPHLRWQAEHPDHVYHLLVARVAERQAWRARLSFETALHYPVAITQQPAYAPFVRAACPEAERWAAECVSLPCFPELTDDELERIAGELTTCRP